MPKKVAEYEGSVEDALLSELRFSGLEEENLKELVGIVAQLQRGGLKRLKCFPKGIPANVDGLRVSGIVDLDGVNTLLGDLIVKIPRLGPVVLFPYGIPWPELFKVNIDLGAPIETRVVNQF